MSFSPGDVLLVPVVFSDGSGHKKRPVVVVYDSGDADHWEKATVILKQFFADILAR